MLARDETVRYPGLLTFAREMARPTNPYRHVCGLPLVGLGSLALQMAIGEWQIETAGKFPPLV